MTRDELEHLLRAASRIAEDPDVVVVGSQAILGSFGEWELPDEAVGSIEADFCFRDDVDNAKSDRVDGAIGELSAFHASFGVYAQGVSLDTAVLPAGWVLRLVVLDTPATEPGRGLCLERHDLVVSKLVARREKDFEFVEALLREGLVDADEAIRRVEGLPVALRERDRITAWLKARRGTER